MTDPFLIDGPTCISFSGGRTSAYMLRRVLKSNGGTLPADTVVCFANTGKESEETLRFVKDCSERWAVPISWVEYAPHTEAGFVTVSFDTASRKGEPFDALIERKKYLPNPIARFCTVELKIIPAIGLMRSLGIEAHDNLVGMRADEPGRVAKIRANPSGGATGVERRAPLADAGIGNAEVLAFWKRQSFDLGLQVINGHTFLGNCDLCFNKPPFQRLSIIKQKPEAAVWWMAKEKQTGATFAKNEPSYAQLARFAADQRDMFDPDQEAISCFCGD